MSRSRLRPLLASLGTAAIVLPLGWFWQASLMPDTYSVMEMGYLDFGGGPTTLAASASGHDHGALAGLSGGQSGGTRRVARSVDQLVADPDRRADVTVDLVAEQRDFTLASGRHVSGYTLNGESPGPLIEADQGDLVEVRLHNESVQDGMTLHWHGVDVPNAADGVAGVTQDAVGPGEEHTYRFVAEDAGTYWYHSHQVSHIQVIRGLLGTLVVHPEDQDPAVVDQVAVAHTYGGTRTLNGLESDLPVVARPGQEVRLRLVNTDNAPTEAWSSVPYRVAAVDGIDLNGPTPVTDRAVTVTAGGRVDLELIAPADGSAARVQVGITGVVVGPEDGTAPDVEQPGDDVDLLGYGTPADLGFDPTEATRHFDYSIGRRPGFIDGRPGMWWSINGHLWPNVPMFVVDEGDVVGMRLENHSGEVHPMHLHGHHAVVLSRDGVPSTGSPWWFDSLNVEDGETYDVAFVADNPGVWMDHCHNLQHAAEGLLAHLMYADVETPYLVGTDKENSPE